MQPGGLQPMGLHRVRHCRAVDTAQHILCVCACANLLQLCLIIATLWSAAQQAPPSMVFYRQEYRSQLPFPSARHLPDPGIQPGLLGLLHGRPHHWGCCITPSRDWEDLPILKTVLSTHQHFQLFQGEYRNHVVGFRSVSQMTFLVG